MAPNNPPPPYHVQKLLDDPGAFAHHSSISALWETKWKFPCSRGIYPFVDGRIEDFEPIFQNLAAISNNDTSILFDLDAYAKPFMPVGEKLVTQAKAAEDSSDFDKAKELYLRAAAVYRIARFPISRSKLSHEAWRLGKQAYIQGSKYLDPPNAEVMIPFVHANVDAGDKETDIPAYIRIPKADWPTRGWPVLLFICGLDAYRTDHTNRTDKHVQAGFATISIEIPGTGDCPAAFNDPAAPDRLWSSVLDWISANAEKYNLDDSKIVARGVSTGGYYAFRIAHTHSDRLIGSVGQGGWSHYALEPEWIRAMNHMEYPFALGDAFAYKLGYGSIEEMIADDAKAKFSLDDNGRVLDRPACRTLVINGVEDSIFPIEDSILVATRGRVKDIRLVEVRSHMGNPEGEQVIMDWINEIVAGTGTARKVVKA